MNINIHIFVFCSSRCGQHTGSSGPGKCEKRRDYKSQGLSTSKRQETTGGKLFMFGQQRGRRRREQRRPTNSHV